MSPPRLMSLDPTPTPAARSRCECATPKPFTVTDELFEGLFCDSAIHTATFTVCDACGGEVSVRDERGQPRPVRRHRHKPA